VSTIPGGAGGDDEDSGGHPDEPRHRLDPDRAAAAARRRAPTPAPPRIVDTRRYQRLIGLFGLVLVIVVSVSFLTTRGVGTAGIPAGKRLQYFAAPLAVSTLNGDANLNPPCTLDRHDPRALNICLLARRAPLVLAFFVVGSSVCERELNAMQAVSRELAPGQVQFAAVAVRATHRAAASAVRSHHWTIPVAYDLDGAIGAAYGVEVCPIVELAYRGGVVARRLIGEHWATSAALRGPVNALVRGP
jgi:peroxiredoxin